jgi:squalene-hopene/tetraprenyl-beta-curcumene cyclase
MNRWRTPLILGACLAWLCVIVVRAQHGGEPAKPGDSETLFGPRPMVPALLNLSKSGPNRADEPYAKALSLAKTREFLDEVAVNWTRDRKCEACHTNIPYMIGRASLGPHTPAADEVRKFVVDRATHWDSMRDSFTYSDPTTTKGEGLVFWFPQEVIVTAAMLTMDDAGTTGTLAPITRDVLDRMWTLQRQDGGFYWQMGIQDPFVTSEYYGVALAAVATGMAPEAYASTPKAQAGLKKLRIYLQDHADTAFLHDRLYALWASTRIPGLLTPAERDDIVKQVLALQKADGGWSLPSLGNWRRADRTYNDRVGAPSDGYGTGLVTYVLRQTGRPADEPVMARAVQWLRTNQRASGRWFTRSLNTDTYHFIANTGTVYAAMALTACGIPVDAVKPPR